MLVVVFIYLFLYLSIYLSIYLFTYGWYAMNYNFMHSEGCNTWFLSVCVSLSVCYHVFYHHA